MSTRIIGVHSGHDAAACLLVDNILLGAIAREGLIRRKHDHGDTVECVDYLLTRFGLAPADIDPLVCGDWHDATCLREDRYCCFGRVEKPRRHHLLHAYAASDQALDAHEGLTGRVALINTPFNSRDEPIVETLAQARASAAAIGRDHLYAHGAVEGSHA